MTTALARPDGVVDLIPPGADVIVPLANGEPVSLVAALDEHADRLTDVTVHQMHALHDHPYLHGERRPNLTHHSYFLSPITRPAFASGGCDLVPSHFSEVPLLLRERTRSPIVLAAASPPDRHGYFSLGTNADYVASFIGTVPFVLEVNAQMPATHGRNLLHRNQVEAWVEVDRPLVEVTSPEPTEVHRRIAEHVVERIPHGATIQAGIGSIPDAVVRLLMGHKDLGVHTELLSDGLVSLVEAGVVTGIHKRRRPNRLVTTFALGTKAVYDFLDGNPVVEMLPVEFVNDPRIIAQHDHFVSINATTEVDLLGQCASETIGGRYWSGSGGQADFARGAMYSDGGQGFIVLPSTARGGTVSRIVPTLTAGSVVTTLKNTVDHVVTEHGVARLRGRSVRDRADALIDIAAPEHREGLRVAAQALGYV
jgi:acyl-CoA hydrolase